MGSHPRRTKIAARLDRARDKQKLPLNVCIQVNIDQEKQKSGVLPDELRNMVDYVNKLPRLKLRGLMAIPSVDVSSERNRESFSKMHALFKTYRQSVAPIGIRFLWECQLIMKMLFTRAPLL
ncbi:MAG: hypothetical protein CM1200mP24_04310 [Gammaproteobacteria bacterium]|nr:MAG: hypothetical protein CM1200mP24_04310 [Gammaproteobacteria bacterium]